MRRVLSWFFVVTQALGCADGASSGAEESGVRGDAACPARERLPIVVLEHDGRPHSTYVETRHAGQRGFLHVDTASARTLLVADGDQGYVPNAVVWPIGCRSWTSDAYFGPHGRLPDVEGRPVLGSAGADLFRGAPSIFDVRGRTWTRSPTAEDRTVLAGAVRPKHAWVEGTMVVEAAFGGVPVRLKLDTGAGHSLWLGQAPRPGDVEIVTQDYLGRELRVFASTIDVTVGSVTRTLPILRAPSFPGVEEDFARLGIHGLLGLSAIDALFVDEASGDLAIRLPP